MLAENEREEEQRDQIGWINPEQTPNEETVPVARLAPDVAEVDTEAAYNEENRYTCPSPFEGEQYEERFTYGKIEKPLAPGKFAAEEPSTETMVRKDSENRYASDVVEELNVPGSSIYHRSVPQREFQ